MHSFREHLAETTAALRLRNDPCLPGWIVVALFCLGSLLPAQDLQRERPLFLEKLDVRMDQPVDINRKVLLRTYRNRPLGGDLKASIGNSIRDQLRQRGYYFSRTDSISTRIDSSRYAASMVFFLHRGKPLVLDSIRQEYTDSVGFEIRRTISRRADEYRGRPYTDAISLGLFKGILEVLENNGYPLARLQSGDFEVKENGDGELKLSLPVIISPGDSIRLSYLVFPREKSRLSRYLERLIRFRSGRVYSQEDITRWARILRRQDFLKRVEDPLLARDKEGNYFLTIDFVEAPSTAFDGVVGYIPPPSNDAEASGYFTGLLNIGVRNLFGGGRKLQIFWQKQDKFSDEFRLGYLEPFVAGLPFNTRIGMYRLVRDTTFIEWQYNLNLEVPLNESLSGFVNLSTRKVAPDSLASRTLRLPLTSSLITESGIRWDVRDEPINPTRGILLELAIGISSQKNNGPDYLLAEDSLLASETFRQIRLDLAVFLPTLRQQVLSNEFHLKFLESSSGEIRIPDQTWFGGATTVRGFREAQFSAKRVAWLKSEYRFLLGRDSRFFVFTDNAWYTRSFPDRVEEWLTSYGVGLRFGGPLGIVQFDYGLESGTPFREGKIHFRLINEF